MEIITHSPEETIEAGKEFAKSLHKGDFVAYTGDLGAGKTTFSRGVVLGLGGDDIVTSPTFAIVNEYGNLKIPVYHFDMYRIMGDESLESTGFFDYPLDESIFLVEWTENIKNNIPKNAIKVNIKYIDENTRKILITR